jgi:hypothetical protein
MNLKLVFGTEYWYEEHNEKFKKFAVWNIVMPY